MNLRPGLVTYKIAWSVELLYQLSGHLFKPQWEPRSDAWNSLETSIGFQSGMFHPKTSAFWCAFADLKIRSFQLLQKFLSLLLMLSEQGPQPRRTCLWPFQLMGRSTLPFSGSTWINYIQTFVSKTTTHRIWCTIFPNPWPRTLRFPFESSLTGSNLWSWKRQHRRQLRHSPWRLSSSCHNWVLRCSKCPRNKSTTKELDVRIIAQNRFSGLLGRATVLTMSTYGWWRLGWAFWSFVTLQEWSPLRRSINIKKMKFSRKLDILHYIAIS